MIDRLRDEIQQRLDQLTHEADRLRKALVALDPRSPSAPAPARKPAAAARKPAAPTNAPAPAARAKADATATKSAPARRARKPAAARSGGRTAPGATKASVLAALADGDALTAGQVADKTGLERGTVSTTLSKLAKSGEVQKAARGYQRAPAGN